jgi:MSHA biogenesis protein MshQ
VNVHTGATVVVENVTCYSSSQGISAEAGTTMEIRNTISLGGSSTDFRSYGTVSVFSNNMYSVKDGTADWAAVEVGAQAPPADLEDLFITVGTSSSFDHHLELSGHNALDTGLSLWTSFTDDIDGEPRVTSTCATWDLGADEATGAPGLCHFEIVHDEAAVNCQAENVQITIHDGLHNTSTTYTGTITLSTSTGHGDWSLVSGSGDLSNSGSGDATYTFDFADNGQVVLGLRDTYVETTNIDISASDLSERSDEDPDLPFARTGFNFLANGTKNTIGAQIAGKDSDVAPGAQTIELQAIKTSDETGQCEAALQGVNLIELAAECVNPTSCTANQVTVGGTAIAGNTFGSALTYTAVSLDFGGSSDTTATLVFSYADVGKIKLHARNTLTPSFENMLGSSNEVVVRPFGFYVSVAGNPGATGPTGSIFTSAGTTFSATARAVLWDAADDADNDGQADGHGDGDPANNADLSDNIAALNYGQETVKEALTLSSSLVAPAAGNNPALAGGTGIASFAAGSGTTVSVRYDEVGIIEISAGLSDTDYLGIGTTETAKILGSSGYVGRFTPDYFSVWTNTPSFGTGCGAGGFTYMSQPFTYSTAPVLTAAALSATGTTTQNYTGSWIKLTNASLTGRTYTAATGTVNTGGLPGTGSDPAIGDNGDGTVDLTFGSGSGLSFDRTGLVAPFDADLSLAINVIDSDAVAYSLNPATFGQATAGNGIAFTGSKEQRFGRVVVVNNHGSELMDLSIPVQAQYYDGTSFVDHTADTCSGVAVGDLTLTYDPPGLSTPTVGNNPFALGDAGLSFSAPGSANTGEIDIEVDLSSAGLSWLRYDWPADGTDSIYDDNPLGKATFGVYAGEDEIIYVREMY